MPLEDYHVRIDAELLHKIQKELRTHGGSSLKDQTINFWTWYLYAKESGQLLKPENQESIPKHPDAPNCTYHSSSDEQWYCDDHKLPKKVWLARFRRHNQEKKKCMPSKLEPKPRPSRWTTDSSGRNKIDWGDGDHYGGYFDFSER